MMGDIIKFEPAKSHLDYTLDKMLDVYDELLEMIPEIEARDDIITKLFPRNKYLGKMMDYKTFMGTESNGIADFSYRFGFHRDKENYLMIEIVTHLSYKIPEKETAQYHIQLDIYAVEAPLAINIWIALIIKDLNHRLGMQCDLTMVGLNPEQTIRKVLEKMVIRSKELLDGYTLDNPAETFAHDIQKAFDAGEHIAIRYWCDKIEDDFNVEDLEMDDSAIIHWTNRYGKFLIGMNFLLLVSPEESTHKRVEIFIRPWYWLRRILDAITLPWDLNYVRVTHPLAMDVISAANSIASCYMELAKNQIVKLIRMIFMDSYEESLEKGDLTLKG